MANYPIHAIPVVIIGAGRSGTNMLRDVLCSLDGVATWPCDEINYIWRHGNRNFSTDELTRLHATDRVIKYIRGRFERFVANSELSCRPLDERIVVEKTCANSLRVPFVDAVLPEALYIHLIRDGRDVVGSALHRWKAPLDIPYLMAKAHYVPKTDLPYYAVKYFLNRLSKLFSSNSSLSVWGPKFVDMEQLYMQNDLSEVCAAQWVRCVESSARAFADMPSTKVFQLRYEDFVADPVSRLQDVTEFLSVSCSDAELVRACEAVRKGSVGKSNLATKPGMDKANALMGSTLSTYGYL